jgi:hypothetical protein
MVDFSFSFVGQAEAGNQASEKNQRPPDLALHSNERENQKGRFPATMLA